MENQVVENNADENPKESPKTGENDDGTVDDKKVMEDGELNDDQESNRDEEDVPDDFFDDFSNEDFMDGLDIVDAWDESEKNKQRQELNRNGDKRRDKRNKDRKSHERSRGAERERRKRSEDKRRRSRSRDRKNSPHRKKNNDEFDLRRDPDKTKRDLERDRENYAKKKEQKLISKVVETGLVPPGMETEVNLNEIQSAADKEIVEKVTDDSMVEKPRGEFSKTSREGRSRDKSREMSRGRRRRRSRTQERYSPSFRDRNRERSNSRRRERRDRSRDRRSRDRVWNKNPFVAPPHRRRRTRSPSERERWLNQRRSVSPERKYRNRIGEEKISFLEELKMKLDGFPINNSPVPYPHHQGPAVPEYASQSHQPNIFPPIQVLPSGPSQFYPPAQNSPYDQSFFIGDPQPVPPANVPSFNPTQLMGPGPQGNSGLCIGPGGEALSPMVEYTNVSQSSRYPIGPVPPPNPALIPAVPNIGENSVAKLMEQIRASTVPKADQIRPTVKDGTAAQLLDERKLSLTDFLSMTSRPTAYSSSSPDALQKKVGVLSRCQDVLKELSGDKKIGGKLTVTKCSKIHSNHQAKNVSPLLRKEPVRFFYSTPSKNSEKPSYFNILNKVLVKSKVISEIIDLDECDSPFYSEAPPPPPPVITKQKFQVGIAGKESDRITPKGVLMKMCQTDPLRCETCEKRKAVQFESIGIQCGETERYNVGVQVTEADIISSKIPKNQSLAHLTPAQLLGRSEPTSTKIDHFGNPYGRSATGAPFFRDSPDYREWPRISDDVDSRREEYLGLPYAANAMRDPRFPRY